MDPHARKINGILKELYPDAKCELNYESPLQLLIATILSAQCTDIRVNQVTPTLFSRYPSCKEFADAFQPEIEKIIHSTGFFRNKAKNILNCCRILMAKHGGEVPRNMDELVALPGVGRKTANVILGNAFGLPGLPVDTHVARLSFRLGFTKHSDPVKIERDLHQIFPARDWTLLAHRLIFHGRRVCSSRSPNCMDCKLEKICPKLGVIKTKRKQS